MKSIFSFITVLLITGSLKAQELQITSVANEGVLIKVGKNKVIIDGIFKSTYPQFESTSDEILMKLVTNKSPFDEINLILASHIHSDHFTPVEVATVLSKIPKALFYSNQQIVNKLMNEKGAIKIKKKKVQSFDHSMKVVENFGDISVTTFPIAHAGKEKTAWIENTGHLIEINGYKILHVGDPYFGKDDLNKMNLKSLGLDVAILPYWFLNSDEGNEVVEEVIGATHYIANHIPTANKSEVSEYFKNKGQITVLENTIFSLVKNQ